MYNTSYKTKMCLAEFKGFAQLCLCRRVRIRNFVFPALVTAFSPRALLGFGVFKLRHVLLRKVPNNIVVAHLFQNQTSSHQNSMCIRGQRHPNLLAERHEGLVY